MVSFLVRCFLIGLLVAPLAAQEPIVNAYRVLHDSTLSSTARSITVQMPAVLAGTGAHTVRGMVGSASCEAATFLTISRSGTAATETVAAVVPVSADNRFGSATSVAVATAWTQSDAGAGVVLNVIPIPAGIAVPFSLTDIRLQGAGITKNFTVKTDAVSGRCVLFVKFQEY